MKALLVIDVQKGYMERYGRDLLTAINSRIDEAVSKNELLIYVKNVRHLKSGNVINEFAEDLAVRSSNIIHKEQASVFDNDDLTALLREHDVTEVEVIGIDGCCCVARSAEDAKALGYTVTMPCAYIGVKNAARFEKKKAQLEKLGVGVDPR